MDSSAPDPPSSHARRHIVAFEVVGFSAVVASIWMTEVVDPPFNVSQGFIETTTVIVVGVIVVAMTRRLLERIKTLEGFLTICASCKKIRIDGQWVPIERFLAHGSELQLSHGVCNDCNRKLYPELWTVG